jgi:hypothetical protein
MLMMDSSRLPTIDYGGDPLAAHRPGFRRAADQAVRDTSDRAYDEMVKQAQNAWKSETQRIADTERAAEPPLCEDAREDAYQR